MSLFSNRRGSMKPQSSCSLNGLTAVLMSIHVKRVLRHKRHQGMRPLFLKQHWLTDSPLYWGGNYFSNLQLWCSCIRAVCEPPLTHKNANTHTDTGIYIFQITFIYAYKTQTQAASLHGWANQDLHTFQQCEQMSYLWLIAKKKNKFVLIKVKKVNL